MMRENNDGNAYDENGDTDNKYCMMMMTMMMILLKIVTMILLIKHLELTRKIYL